MKTFYAAIALFLLLLCLILANTLFLHRVTDELELRLHKISTENAYGALTLSSSNAKIVKVQGDSVVAVA